MYLLLDLIYQQFTIAVFAKMMYIHMAALFSECLVFFSNIYILSISQFIQRKFKQLPTTEYFLNNIFLVQKTKQNKIKQTESLDITFAVA